MTKRAVETGVRAVHAADRKDYEPPLAPEGIRADVFNVIDDGVLGVFFIIHIIAVAVVVIDIDVFFVIIIDTIVIGVFVVCVVLIVVVIDVIESRRL